MDWLLNVWSIGRRLPSIEVRDEQGDDTSIAMAGISGNQSLPTRKITITTTNNNKNVAVHKKQGVKLLLLQAE